MEQVLIAGAGVAGLSLALTLHQIGVPFTVLESVSELKPLGVGINVQPNAVRELMELGITKDQLNTAGVPAKEWALVGRHGQDIYAEPRGSEAGYNWPQYAMHRGKFQMLLANEVVKRAGPDAIQLGARVTGYTKRGDGVTAHITHKDGSTSERKATLLIGADGIHSNIRAQMHPDQPPINWGGTVMWRGTTRAKPIRTGSSFVGLGGVDQRMVIYPISDVGPDGTALINWIAEIRVKDQSLADRMGWYRQVPISDFAQHFEHWRYDWLDVPALLRGADVAYENPMIDRDPAPMWHDGPVALMGDAAHAMYPTGSNGASQAVMDAREIGAAFLAYGITPDALAAYNEKLCAPVSALVLRNRGDGPFGLLSLVAERSDGMFEDINDVIPRSEREAFMAAYKTAAGFAMDTLNAAPPMIAQGARVSPSSGLGTAR